MDPRSSDKRLSVKFKRFAFKQREGGGGVKYCETAHNSMLLECHKILLNNLVQEVPVQ